MLVVTVELFPGGDPDTIPIDDAGFFALTGQLPKTAAEYQKIDREFWDSVRSAA